MIIGLDNSQGGTEEGSRTKGDTYKKIRSKVEKGVTLKKCWEKQINQNKKENEQKRVAVIGGGPSGLTASAFLNFLHFYFSFSNPIFLCVYFIINL